MHAPIQDIDATLRRVRRLAKLMDSRWRVPLLGWRVGLDPLLGLLPGGGDAISLLLGGYVLFQARKLGAPPGLVARMGGNIALDFAVGTVPLVGDLFDVVFKANTRNVELLERWAREAHGASPQRA